MSNVVSLPTQTVSTGPTVVVGSNTSPFKFPSLWDGIILGEGESAFAWAGKVQFIGAKRSFHWQVKDGPGAQGETYTYRGLKSKTFRMRIEVWTDAQWQMLPSLVAFFSYDALKPNPDGTANPVVIYHPSLDAIDISQVLCEDIVAPEVDQEHSGAAWWEFVLREYRPAPKQNVTSTPTSVQTPIVILNRSGGSTGQTIQANQQSIENLSNTLADPGVLP